MTGEIIYAVQQEILALFADTGASFILRDDFKSSDWPSYKLPLVVAKVEEDNEDVMEYPGGLTQLGWRFILSGYNYQPNQDGSDPTDYSATRINVIDTIRTHFKTFGVFTTPEMATAFTNYGIRWTLSGIQDAEQLEHPDGMVLGKAIVFDTISFDRTTRGWNDVTPLQTIQQIGYPPV